MNYNKMIDHTILKPEAGKAKVDKIIDEAMEYGFASVCINPCWVSYAAKRLENSDVKVCTVIGFPLGATTSATKAFEAKEAIENGADEVDMVLNIGALKDQNYDYVQKDIEAVVAVSAGKCVKVILETCLLTDDEIVEACKICMKAKATFVKTSTGFSTAGSNPHVVKIMKDTVGDVCFVKAAGGVRTPEDMYAVVEAGASRIGTSSGCKLVNKPE